MYRPKVKYYRLQNLTSLLILPLVVAGCQSELDKKASVNSNAIQQKIQEDLQDGLSGAQTLELDLPDLPNTVYRAEMEHSSVSFRTKHWEILDLIGWFEDFAIVMYADETDFSDAVIYAKVDPLSVKMPNLKMAGSVQKTPYLDAETYREMTFLSKKLHPISANNYILSGVMTINGIEKEMDFDVIFNGFAYPGEKPICGFEASGKINRNDFKIGGQDLLHSGRKVHGDTIELFMALRME